MEGYFQKVTMGLSITMFKQNRGNGAQKAVQLVNFIWHICVLAPESFQVIPIPSLLRFLNLGKALGGKLPTNPELIQAFSLSQ